MSKTRLLVMLALLGVTAQRLPAQAPHPYDLFLSEWRPPPGQRCELGDTPVLSALVDTAALYAKLSGITRGRILLAWVKPDTVGWRPEYGPLLDSMLVLERTVSDSTARLIHDAMLASLQQSKDAPPSALLRLDFDGSPVLRTARSLVCRPSVIEDSSLNKYRARMRATVGPEPRNAVIGFIVGRDGETHAPRILSSSGDAVFDAAALGAAAVLHYRPGLYNRVPVAVFVRFPVQVQQRMQ